MSDEFSVESCLKELRQVLPDRVWEIICRAGQTPSTVWANEWCVRSFTVDTTGTLWSERHHYGSTLFDCMNQVRAYKHSQEQSQ